MTNCCFAYSIRNNSRTTRRHARRMKVQRVTAACMARERGAAQAAAVTRIAISLRIKSLLN
jgi:hypothetical protein